MSIRLDISVLNDTIQVCNSVSEKLGDSANEAMAATFGLGDSWHGSSYDELVNYANSSLVPCACIVSGAAKTLASGLEEVRKVASRLLSRARGFQGIFNGEGVGSPSEDLTSGVLYYDENYDYLIYSAIVNARNEIASARRELSAVNTELSKLQTVVHPIDTTYAFGELQSISNRIDEFEASYTAFKNDLENLEAASRSCEEKLDGVFNPASSGAIYDYGSDSQINPIALMWLSSLPYQLLNDNQRDVADKLKKDKVNIGKLNLSYIRAFGIEGEGVYEEGNLIQTILNTLGIPVGAFYFSFESIDKLIGANNWASTHISDYPGIRITTEELKMFRGILTVVDKIAWYIALADAVVDGIDYECKNRNRLGDRVRYANAATVATTHFIHNLDPFNLFPDVDNATTWVWNAKVPSGIPVIGGHSIYDGFYSAIEYPISFFFPRKAY